MSNDISLPETKFEHAFDAYYTFLRRLVQGGDGDMGPNQRVVTLNTITPFAIVKDKLLAVSAADRSRSGRSGCAGRSI